MGKSNPVTMVEQYVLGNEGTPFYTREVCTDRPQHRPADAAVLPD